MVLVVVMMAVGKMQIKIQSQASAAASGEWLVTEQWCGRDDSSHKQWIVQSKLGSGKLSRHIPSFISGYLPALRDTEGEEHSKPQAATGSKCKLRHILNFEEQE